MSTSKVKINNIQENSENPRNISDQNYEKLKKSIQDFPEMLETRPLVVDEKNTVIGGNMRLRVLKDLGYKEVPTEQVSWTEEQKKEFIIKDNVAFGEWDWEDLGENWDVDDLKEWGLDIPENWYNEEVQVEEDNYEVPDEEKIETDIVLGDLIEIGEHRLLCGDSTDSDQVAKLMDGEKADMVFTDPPYGVNYQSNMRTKTQKFDVLENDNVFATEWINNLPLFSKGFVFVWTSWKVLKQWIDFCQSIGELSNLIIWNKGGGGIGDLKKTFSTDFEVALVYNRGAEIKGKRLGSVWSIGKDGSEKYLHPTQKPVELSAMAIENIIYENELVLDLFLGSGSTMLAAHQLNRKCYGMELDPKYCQVVIDRMLNYDPNIKIFKNGDEFTEHYKTMEK